MRYLKTKRNLLVATIFIVLSSCGNSVLEDTSPAVTTLYSDTWKFHAGEGTDSLWMSPEYNDLHWIDVTSTKLLKDQDIAPDNGFGWYRKTIQFNDSLKNAIKNKGAAVINLGRLAACDEVYVNGNLIGKTGKFPHDFMGYFDKERNYVVYTKDLNLEGDNQITIKFHDGWNIGGFLEGAQLSISSANTKDKLALTVNVSDSDYIFMDNVSFGIGVNIENNNNWAVKGMLLVTLTTDDYKPVSKDSLEVTIKGSQTFNKEFSYVNPQPGFYRYTIQYKHNGETICENKFNVGYEPEKISSPRDAQPDFNKFWDNNLKDLAKVAPAYKLIPIPEASELDYNMYRVEMRSLGGELIQGYYAKPKKEGKHPVVVEYMGYGSKPYFPNQWWDGFAYFVLSIRGQALNQPDNKYGTWITYGLEDKNNYYYRGAFMDVVRAIDFVCSRPEIDSEKIAVRGGSQGGALSFVAAALDKRVKAAAPTIPFLSDYPDYFKIAPWPKSDFDAYLKNNPNAKQDDIYKLLSYFDIKNLAQAIEAPLLMGIGVQDNVCPPHINFAAYNQVNSQKAWMAFPDYGHSVGKEFYEASMNMFREKLNVEKP